VDRREEVSAKERALEVVRGIPIRVVVVVRRGVGAEVKRSPSLTSIARISVWHKERHTISDFFDCPDF
jgi:hypothetical protein